MDEPSSLPFGINFRSMGMKLILVCTLALFMTIPALFVEALIQERTGRSADVVQERSGHVGGQQTFLGPTLAIPYTIPPQSPSDTARHGMYLVFPATASAVLKTATEERRRSLFKVPVFQADLKMDATLDLSGVPSSAPQGAALDWSRAELVVGVSDARGAQTDALLTTNGKTSTLVPAVITQYLYIIFGLIACAGVIPLALIAGHVRGIPLPWRLIDCSFGILGSVLLLICRRSILALERRGRL